MVSIVDTLSERPRVVLGAGSGVDEGPFDALGFRFRVRISDMDLGGWTRATFAALRCSAPAVSTYSIVDHGESYSHVGRWAVYRDDDVVTHAFRRRMALAALLQDINNQAVTHATQESAVLHAAAAARDGVGVLLPAPMESGKSTTVAGLVAAGFDYLTDEAAMLDPETSAVRPFPKAIALDVGSWSVLPQLRPAHTPLSRQWQVPPTEAGTVARAPVTVGVIVAPRFERGARTEVTPVSRAQMLYTLSTCTFAFGESPRRNIATIAKLVEGAACFDLTIGSLPEATALINQLVDRVLGERCAE
jgi:hypothetical protein